MAHRARVSHRTLRAKVHAFFTSLYVLRRRSQAIVYRWGMIFNRISCRFGIRFVRSIDRPWSLGFNMPEPPSESNIVKCYFKKTYDNLSLSECERGDRNPRSSLALGGDNSFLWTDALKPLLLMVLRHSLVRSESMVRQAPPTSHDSSLEGPRDELTRSMRCALHLERHSI